VVSSLLAAYAHAVPSTVAISFWLFTYFPGTGIVSNFSLVNVSQFDAL